MSLNPAQNPSPLAGKIAGMIGSGAMGGNLAQDHFVQISQYCKVKIFKDQKIQIKRY